MAHELQSLLVIYGDGVVGIIAFLNNIGIPVPGDTVLLASGFFVDKGILHLGSTIFSGTLGCFMGANCSYWVGSRFGYPLLPKISWLKLTPEKLIRIERFFEKHGSKTVFFARFVALLHPITGFLAGMGHMPSRDFVLYNLAGSTGYVCVYVLAGYFLGERWGLVRIWIGDIVVYVLLMIAIIIGVFLGVLVWKLMRDFYQKRKISKE